MFATAALAVRTYWYKLKNLFRRKERGAPEAPREERRPDSKPAAD
jgi:hypothetical protein